MGEVYRALDTKLIATSRSRCCRKTSRLFYMAINTTASETDRYQRYVTRYPSLEGRWQLPPGRGTVVWRADGREIYYPDFEDRLWAMKLELDGDEVVLGDPELLFDGRSIGARFINPNARPRVATRNGQDFVVIRTSEQPRTFATWKRAWLPESVR